MSVCTPILEEKEIVVTKKVKELKSIKLELSVQEALMILKFTSNTNGFTCSDLYSQLRDILGQPNKQHKIPGCNNTLRLNELETSKEFLEEVQKIKNHYQT